ncbi:phosphomethylpyrimidine synthase ThiC [Thermogladius sp. 4427co]|uniref:phosphomethylpyrimidine synthase ThiC n=1 Tax=Thermogladius sp. 4427co TaxID=3450718 RepID=UPI003F7A9CAA
MSLFVEARSSSYVDAIAEVASREGVDYEKLRKLVASGRVIIPRNVKKRKARIIGIGEGLRTKVNVNVGTSGVYVDIDLEKRKVETALKYGTDTIMDLSTGGDLNTIRRILLEASDGTPFGTVPTYQAWIEGVRRFGNIASIPKEWFLEVVESHLRDGVDFMTIHAAISRELAEKAVKSKRIMPIVSRGGSMIAVWMLERGEENPYLTQWDHLLELFREYDAVISLGDALRPGALADALDELQVSELVVNARLARYSVSRGVQVMIEGPGHMRLDKIVADVKLAKTLSNGVPYYVLGPLVTDIAAGYDHISSAIGAAIASAAGADLICYLTPAEHLGLPNEEQVKEGLIAARIAAHAGDLVKLGSRAAVEDIRMSIARAELDWKTQIEMSMDREKAISIRNQFGGAALKSCTMCGQYCVFLLLDKYMKTRPKPTLEELMEKI